MSHDVQLIIASMIFGGVIGAAIYAHFAVMRLDKLSALSASVVKERDWFIDLYHQELERNELLDTFTHAGLLPAIESQAAHLAANPDLDWRGIPSSILRDDLEQRYQDGEYARAGVRLMQLMVKGAGK